MAKLWIACEAALFGAFALAVRALPWRRVLDESSVHFAGNDAFYHARRIAVAVGDFAAVPVRDFYLNFPSGGEPIWTSAFDGLAAFAAQWAGATDPAAMDRFIVWLPPWIGAVGVIATWAVARSFVGPSAARVAAGLLAIIPAHFTYSQMGFVDHHVLVATSCVLLLGATLGTLAALESDGPGRGALWAAAIGLAMAVCLLVWPGMLLHVAIAEACLLVMWMFAQETASRVAWTAAAAQAIALCAVAPFSLGHTWERWGSFSPVVLTNFQPWLFVCGLVVFVVAGLATSTGRGPSGALARLFLALTAAAAALACTFLFLPGVLDRAVADAWEWFARTEAFQADVSESRPIFLRRGQIAWLQPALLLTPLFYVLPFILYRAWRGARSSPDAAGGASQTTQFVLLAWALVLLAATLAQARFFNSFSIVMCLVLGASWMRWMHGSAQAPKPFYRWVVAAALSLVVAGSCGWYYRELLADPTTWGRPGEPSLPTLEQRRRMVAAVGDWIAQNTPETSGWLNPTVRPEYAVMAPWTDGHVLTYRGRRPNIANNFGDDIGRDNFAISEAFYLADAASASDVLDQLGARYVLFEYRPIRRLREFGPKSVLSRLYFADGGASDEAVMSRGGELRSVSVSTSALGRYRLVMETGPKRYSKHATLPGFKLYEHVAGAKLEGRATPGATVVFSLDLNTSAGRSWTFVAKTHADDNGRYVLVVPYETGAGGEASVAADGLTRSVSIDEASVQAGQVVPGPDLTGDQGANEDSDSGRGASNTIPN